MSSKGSIKGHQGWKEVAWNIIVSSAFSFVIGIGIGTLVISTLLPEVPSSNVVAPILGFLIGVVVLVSASIAAYATLHPLVALILPKVKSPLKETRTTSTKLLLLLLFVLHFFFLVFIITFIPTLTQAISKSGLNIETFVENLNSYDWGLLITLVTPLVGIGTLQKRSVIMKYAIKTVVRESSIYSKFEAAAYQIVLGFFLYAIIFALALPRSLSGSAVATLLTYSVWYFVSAGVLIPAVLFLFYE